MSNCPLDSIGSIKKIVLKDTVNKRIIYWEENKLISSNSKVDKIKLHLIIGILAFISFICFYWGNIKQFYKKFR